MPQPMNQDTQDAVGIDDAVPSASTRESSVQDERRHHDLTTTMG
ncbi:hypothetical protein CGMCC3_g2654 [Colletotrichum fructicola]|nr:uncharacterized protein CGMCC3_g2654 [Colletotrichum fructicola]KAE9581341.1 hypothetical protein CGMCC3_g2654 [Colletotrichum fructicola]